MTTLENQFAGYRQGDVLTLPGDIFEKISEAAGTVGDGRSAIVSQTCDLVREDRTTAVLGLVVELAGSNAKLAARGSMPRFAHLPELGANYFIDLDLLISVPKGILLGGSATPGVSPGSWEDVRKLSRAIGRKFSRFAFPDEIVPWLDPLRPVMESKHSKDSALGRVLRAISELRVETTDWSHRPIAVQLHVIVSAPELPEPDDAPPAPDLVALMQSANPTLEQIAALLRPAEGIVRGGTDGATLWALFAQELAALCVRNVDHSRIPGSGSAVHALVGSLWSESEFSILKYRSSEMLDLDHLSPPVVGL